MAGHPTCEPQLDSRERLALLHAKAELQRLHEQRRDGVHPIAKGDRGRDYDSWAWRPSPRCSVEAGSGIPSGHNI